jgi:lipopolysaccharide/colanic/teichoic acid biosynthesis glycosyltransferase
MGFDLQTDNIIKENSREDIILEKNLEIDNSGSLYNIICEQTGNQSIADFIDSQINLSRSERILLLAGQKTNLSDESLNNIRSVVNLKPVNRFKSINNYFVAIQKMLPDAGLFVGCVETYDERKARFKCTYKSIWKLFYIIDFVLNRVFPRLLIIEKIYSFLTKDSYHIISKAEVLGRLVYCGFDIVDFKVIEGMLYFVVINTHEPSNKPVTKYPFIKLPRVGKAGKIIGVYKFRTMHPYSEYIQKFIVAINGYNEVGKPANDFRLTSWGKFLRKVWLDEFPQVINLLLGQMKIVGVRPLSLTRFNELPKEVQEARIKHKPGCFPPYVALNMPSSEDNIEAEIIYMNEKEKNPHTTDIKYLIKSIYNILTNKIRSS